MRDGEKLTRRQSEEITVGFVKDPEEAGPSY